MKFISYQSENPNFENLLWERASTTPVNVIRPIVEFNLSLEKSWKSQGILSLLGIGNPEEFVMEYSPDFLKLTYHTFPLRRNFRSSQK